jgi:hypothetical protein
MTSNGSVPVKKVSMSRVNYAFDLEDERMRQPAAATHREKNNNNVKGNAAAVHRMLTHDVEVHIN